MQAQIIIQIEDSGKFNFVGPLDNKLLCYGMLHLALEALSKHQPVEKAEPAEEPLLVAP